ncbi:hypothetical protein V8F33_014056 [Rhypophila sp. PSN 637]
MTGVSSFTATMSSSMMEHHMPASVLDASKGFSTIIGSDGTQFVFSIGDDNVFRGSADVQNGCSAWLTHDIADALLLPLDGATVKTFAVSYSPVDGTITIALALAFAKKGDQLWVSDGLVSTADADWLADGGNLISWHLVTFDSTAFDNITAATLAIEEITLLLAMQNEHEETPMTHVTVFDPVDSHNRVFTVVVPPGTATPAWTYFDVPFDTSQKLATAGGQPFSGYGQGVYVLGKLAGTTTLDFVPQKTGLPSMTYPVPSDASAIASLVLPDLSKTTTVTELYVAAEGQLIIMQRGNHPQTAPYVAVEGSGYITGTSVFHVGTTFGEYGVDDKDALVIVFELNSKKQVFQTHAVYQERFLPHAWAPVALYLDQVEALAPLINSAIGTMGFLGISSSASVTGTTTYGTPAASALVSVISHPVTGVWEQHSLPVPTTEDYVRLRTYTSKLKVNDPDTGLPLSQTDVAIQTNVNASLLINGISVRCSDKVPTLAKTDSSGSITITDAVSGISATSFTVCSNNGTPLTLTMNGQTVDQPYDPTGTVKSTLTDGMAGDLTALRCKNRDGTTSPLVDGNSPNIDKASSAFKAIKNNMPTKSAAQTLLRGQSLNARAAVARRRCAARLKDPNGPIEMFFADLARWIVTAVEDVADVIVNEVKEGIQVVVHFAEGAFSALIDTIEDAWSAVVSVFKWIGAEFEKIFQWLAFIFDWKEMVKVHTGLSDAIRASVTAFSGEIHGFKKSLDDIMTQARNKIQKNPFGGATNSLQGSVTSNRPNPSVNGTDINSDPRTSWVSDQMNNANNANVTASKSKSLSSSSSALETIRLVSPRAAGAPPNDGSMFADAFATMGHNILAASHADQLGDIGKSASGQGATGDVMWGLVEAMGSTILDALQTGFDGAFPLVEELIQDALSALTSEISIPVLSALYKDLVGSAPSVLDISCLCIGIVTTISYNIVRSADGNLPAIGDYVTGAGFQSMFSDFTPSQQFTRRVKFHKELRESGGFASNAAEGDNKAAVGVLGGIQIFNSFAMLAGNIGESFHYKSLSTVAAILQTLSEFSTGCIALGANLDDPRYADFKTVGAALRLLLLLATGQAVAMRGGLSSTEAAEIGAGAEVVSSVLGVWALIDIVEDISHANATDWLDMLVDTTAFPDMILSTFDVEPAGPILSVLRMIGSESLGICFLNESVSGTKQRRTLKAGGSKRRQTSSSSPALPSFPDLHSPYVAPKPNMTIATLAKMEGETAVSKATAYRNASTPAGMDGGPVEAKEIDLNHYDMAFAINESAANELAAVVLANNPPSSFSMNFSYNAKFEPGADAVFFGSGTLSCGPVGAAAGSGGVLWNFIITNGVATINSTEYKSNGATWVVSLSVDGYQLMESPTASNATQQQLAYMQGTYSDVKMLVCEYGLDYGRTAYTGPTETPQNWQSADWALFCQAFQAFIKANIRDNLPQTQVPLIQGVIPNGAWACFNVPAYNNSYEAAVVFGLMVSGNQMPTDEVADFTGSALFNPSGPGYSNGVLLVSSKLMSQAVINCFSAFLTGMASIGVDVHTNNNTGAQDFSLSTGLVSPGNLTTVANGSPWKATTSGQADRSDKWSGCTSWSNSSAHTSTQASVTIDTDPNTMQNGFYRHLQLSGSYALQGQVNCYASDNLYQQEIPSVVHPWSSSSIINVSGNIVSLSYNDSNANFSNDVTNPPNDANTVNWWHSDQGVVINETVNNVKGTQWATAAKSQSNTGSQNLSSFMTSSQVNLFAFPGGKTYQSAMVGINMANTLVVRLTYVIS